MPDVKQVEEAVGEDDPRPGAGPAQPFEDAGQPVETKHPARVRPRPPHAGRGRPAGAGSAPTARRSSSRPTVAVPRFITTMPPA